MAGQRAWLLPRLAPCHLLLALSLYLLLFSFFPFYFSGAEGGTPSLIHVRQVHFSQATPSALLPFPSDSSGKAFAAFPKVVLQTSALLVGARAPICSQTAPCPDASYGGRRPVGSNIRPRTMYKINMFVAYYDYSFGIKRKALTGRLW